MPPYEKLMFWAAAGIELAYIAFFLLMTDGLTLGDRSPGFLTSCVIGFMIIVALVIAAQQFLQESDTKNFPDEREMAVDTRSEQIGYRVLEAGIFAVIALALLESYSGPNSLGSYSLTRPEGIIFALVTITALAGLTRVLSAFAAARRT